MRGETKVTMSSVVSSAAALEQSWLPGWLARTPRGVTGQGRDSNTTSEQQAFRMMKTRAELAND